MEPAEAYHGSSPTNLLRKVEYASKAVENGGTAIGIRCKDGVVLAVEKIVTSKLLKSGANKRISSVDRNFGMVSCCARCASGGLNDFEDLLRLGPRWKTPSVPRPRRG